VQADEQIAPALDGIHGHLDLLREGGVDELASRRLSEELHQGLHGAEIRDAGDIPEILPR
jgi:hypothetical protein